MFAVAVLVLGGSPSDVGHCGNLIYKKGFGPNMPGKPTTLAATAADCCAFCHSIPGCNWWTWNGASPGNGECYAKASNVSGGGSPSMVSGGVTAGPPVPPPPPAVVSLGEGQTAISSTEPTYASWNVDSSCNRGFHRTDWSNLNLLAAAKGLAPSRLRFGGSGNDALVYGMSRGSPECAGVQPTDCGYTTPGCLNASHWDKLYQFAVGSGSDFIFGLSFRQFAAATPPNASYVWNGSNAASLLRYFDSKGQKIWGFELGNEVNNCDGVTPGAQAAALIALSKMVKATSTNPLAKLIGPDSGYKNWQHWLTAYLPLASKEPGMLHAVTHHVYPGLGRSSFDIPQELSGSTRAEIAWYTEAVRTLAPGAQIWAGEDGPIGGGNSGTCGANSICSTFASSIWYADDLANRALHGFSQYQRQAFVGGNYGLTASANEHPQSALGTDEVLLLRPDYWVNFMWKRTLGTKVFNITSSDSNIRAYAFSGAPPSPFAAPECTAAGQQLLLINLNPRGYPAVVELKGYDFSYTMWSMTPVANASAGFDPEPFSNRAMLNGKLLPDVVDIATSITPQQPAFLERIPVDPVRGAYGAVTLELEALSINFVCNNWVPPAAPLQPSKP